MLGGSDDSGEEEVIEASYEVVAATAPSSTLSLSAVEHSGTTAPQPLAACPAGWARHRSSRYRDASQPEGYEYFHCLATGEVRWAVPTPSSAGSPRGVKRGLTAAPSLYYPSPPPDYLHGQPQEVQRLVALSDGHVTVTPGAGGANEVRVLGAIRNYI